MQKYIVYSGEIIVRLKKRTPPVLEWGFMSGARPISLGGDFDGGLDRRLTFGGGRSGLGVPVHDAVRQDAGALHALGGVLDVLVVGADVGDGNAGDLGGTQGSDGVVLSIGIGSHDIISFVL